MRRHTVLPMIALLIIGCADSPLTTEVADSPQFANGPKGTLTVNSLEDPGDGVCTAEHCTLREAIDAARPGDRIVFKSSLRGTIELNGSQLNVAKDLSIDGGGRITVDAAYANRVFQTSAVVTLAGLVITRGYARAGQIQGPGGGVLNSSVLTLEGVTLAANIGGSGGGIFNTTDGSVDIIGSVITENEAGQDGRGGGVYNGGLMWITAGTIADNRAAGTEKIGGGVFNASSGVLVVERTSIADNAARTGGGLYNFGTLTINRSTVSGNTAVEDGGGLWNAGAANVLLATFSGNTTVNYGGAIYSGSQGVLGVRSSTIAANHGSVGGLNNGNGTAMLTGTILAGNSGYDCVGTITSYGHNLVRSGADGGCPANGTGDVVVAPSQLFTEVLDAALTYNGGPTATHALVERGRAVDAGYCPGLASDQRGFPRPYDDLLMPNALDGCDIGAFEWQPAPAPQHPGKGNKK